MTDKQLAIAICIFGLAALLIAAIPAEDCPRIILGYNCKGKMCDHSPEELEAAKAAMHRHIRPPL